MSPRPLAWSVLIHGAALGTAVLLGRGPARAAPQLLRVDVLPTEDAVAIAEPPPVRELVLVERAERHPPLAEPAMADPQPVDAAAFASPPDVDCAPWRPDPAGAAWLSPVRPARPAAEQPPPAPAPRAPSALVLEVIPGQDPPPPYPWLARRRGWEGTVAIFVRVDADGAVAAAAIARSSGHRVMDEAALRAVRVWQFRGGPGETTVEVVFALRR